jgi:hypothetical protein
MKHALPFAPAVENAHDFRSLSLTLRARDLEALWIARTS